jgi:hypothetical protein
LITVDAERLIASPFGHDLHMHAPHVIEAARQEQKRIENKVAEAKKHITINKAAL